MENAVPMACLLTSSELRSRRTEHLEKLAASLIDFSESGSGYIYRFQPLGSTFEKLKEVVELEKMCCPFLNFPLVENGDTAIQLEISGPENSKEIIRELFQWNLPV